jgi:hypothetical protein
MSEFKFEIIKMIGVLSKSVSGWQSAPVLRQIHPHRSRRLINGLSVVRVDRRRNQDHGGILTPSRPPPSKERWMGEGLDLSYDVRIWQHMITQ